MFAGRFLARAFGAQTVEYGARRLDAEAVGVLQVGGKLVEHMAFERAGRAALKADELAVRGGLGAADIAVARARAVHGGDLGDDAVRDEALYGAVNGGLADRNAVLRQPQADLINGQKVLLLLPEQGEDAVLCLVWYCIYRILRKE